MGWLFGKKDKNRDIINALLDAPVDTADKALDTVNKGFDLADRLMDKLLGR